MPVVPDMSTSLTNPIHANSDFEAPFRINNHPSIHPSASKNPSLPTQSKPAGVVIHSTVHTNTIQERRDRHQGQGVGCHLKSTCEVDHPAGVHHVNKAIDTGAQHAHVGSFLHVQGPLHRPEGSRRDEPWFSHGAASAMP